VQELETHATTVSEAMPVGGSLAETFVVRLWEPPPGGGDRTRDLRGVVRHVRSGRSVTFVADHALLAFLHAERHGAERLIGGAS
jgi:hypothetical protein